MFKIYGSKDCSWCDKAENLLIRCGLKYEVLDAREHIDADPFLANLKANDLLNKNGSGNITVPIIIKEYTLANGEKCIDYIGGYSELYGFKMGDLKQEDFV